MFNLKQVSAEKSCTLWGYHPPWPLLKDWCAVHRSHLMYWLDKLLIYKWNIWRDRVTRFYLKILQKLVTETESVSATVNAPTWHTVAKMRQRRRVPGASYTFISIHPPLSSPHSSLSPQRPWEKRESYPAGYSSTLTLHLNFHLQPTTHPGYTQ